MRTHSRILHVGVLTAVACAAVGQAAAEQDVSPPAAPPSRVAVWVRDDGQVPVEVLSRAKAEVANIYHKAGVNIVWQRPSIPLDASSSRASQFVIALVSSERTRRPPFAATCDALGAATGSASERGRVAYVRYGCIEPLVEQGGLERFYALGVVIAHELGHLLLLYHAHSTSGLMKADWNAADLRLVARGQLFFAPEQAQLIRSRLAEALRDEVTCDKSGD